MQALGILVHSAAGTPTVLPWTPPLPALRPIMTPLGVAGNLPGWLRARRAHLGVPARIRGLDAQLRALRSSAPLGRPGPPGDLGAVGVGSWLLGSPKSKFVLRRRRSPAPQPRFAPSRAEPASPKAHGPVPPGLGWGAGSTGHRDKSPLWGGVSGSPGKPALLRGGSSCPASPDLLLRSVPPDPRIPGGQRRWLGRCWPLAGDRRFGRSAGTVSGSGPCPGAPGRAVAGDCPRRPTPRPAPRAHTPGLQPRTFLLSSALFGGLDKRPHLTLKGKGKGGFAEGGLPASCETHPLSFVGETLGVGCASRLDTGSGAQQGGRRGCVSLYFICHHRPCQSQTQA